MCSEKTDAVPTSGEGGSILNGLSGLSTPFAPPRNPEGLFILRLGFAVDCLQFAFTISMILDQRILSRVRPAKGVTGDLEERMKRKDDIIQSAVPLYTDFDIHLSRPRLLAGPFPTHLVVIFPLNLLAYVLDKPLVAGPYDRNFQLTPTDFGLTTYPALSSADRHSLPHYRISPSNPHPTPTPLCRERDRTQWHQRRSKRIGPSLVRTLLQRDRSARMNRG